MASIFRLLQCLAFLLCVFTNVNYATAKAGNDDQFADFLNGAINNYTNWLQENQLDPSPFTNDSISGSAFYGVQLDCQLSNHYVSGHSKTEEDFFAYSRSNFIEHTLEMRQLVWSPYEFQGDFNCTGILKSYEYPELGSDLEFIGHGKFVIRTQNAAEGLELRNVGITQDYKLDLSQSWSTYTLQAQQKSFSVRGDWNETLISSTYSDVVAEGFANRFYYVPLMYSSFVGFPTGVVLDRYVRQVAEGVDLKEIINAEDLPTPFVPTPKPVTSTASTPIN